MASAGEDQTFERLPNRRPYLLVELGQQIAVQALLYAAFPIAYMVSTRSTYLKGYSRTTSNIMLSVGVVGWYAFFLGVAALATVV